MIYREMSVASMDPVMTNRLVTSTRRMSGIIMEAHPCGGVENTPMRVTSLPPDRNVTTALVGSGPLATQAVTHKPNGFPVRPESHCGTEVDGSQSIA